MWDVRNVGCSGCGMLGMWDVRDVGCWGCGMFRMWDVQNVESMRKRLSKHMLPLIIIESIGLT